MSRQENRPTTSLGLGGMTSLPMSKEKHGGARAPGWSRVVALAMLGLAGFWWRCLAGQADPVLHRMVEEDYVRQEQRWGRLVNAPAASHAALERARRLIGVSRLDRGPGAGASAAAALDGFARRVQGLAPEDGAAWRALYFEIRAFTRREALSHPAVAAHPILFMERRRAVGYMLYEYLGWYYAFGNDPTSGAKDARCPTPEPGGGVLVLEEPGESLLTRELTGGRLPRGHFVTLALSSDAQSVYFAFANPTGADPYTQPGYRLDPAPASAGHPSFHLFVMRADGSDLRQITRGPHDDFDPCPLPDGGLVFLSTRRGSKLRCGGGSPEVAYTLHRMDGESGEPRTLSFHETHEWHPSLLHDGRLVYTRWDYVDRNAAKFHGLWTCNQDGSAPSVLFGNYTTRPWACFQARAIPNSSKILFVAGGHHANVGGALMLFDPAGRAYDPATGEDSPEALESLTPEVGFAEAEGWPQSFFCSPWPLTEDIYLVAFSHDPLPGGYTKHHRDSETGLYYYDRFGNLELLYRKPGISAVYPIPLTPCKAPPVHTSLSDRSAEETGEFFLGDVSRSVLPFPEGRRISALRVFQLLPKSQSDRADDPRMGHPDQSNARVFLGSVPVEADGSAYFVAPARKPLYFQAVDEHGRAVQGMRSVVYLQPGERRSCVGCHEPPGSVPASRHAQAIRRPPSRL